MNRRLACVGTMILLLGAMSVMAYGESEKPADTNKPLFSCSGLRSSIKQKETVIIHDAKAFSDLWQRYNGDKDVSVPKVDFSKYDVVAVFAGMKPTGGYAVEIEDLQKKNGKNFIPVKLISPSKGMIVVQMITYPFAMKAVPKLPANTQIDFNEK